MRADAGEEQAESTMDQQPMTGITEVAACTMAAAHRRDHQHSHAADECHPHLAVVAHGDGPASQVHDLHQLDSGFLPHRETTSLAAGHREQTRHASVLLRCA
jgi:hypothetical protein